ALHGLIYTPLWLQQQAPLLAQVISSIVTTMPNLSVQSGSSSNNTVRGVNAEGQAQHLASRSKSQKQPVNSMATNTSVDQLVDVTGKKDEPLLPLVQHPVAPDAELSLEPIRSTTGSESQSPSAA